MITLIPHCRCKPVQAAAGVGKVAHLYFAGDTNPIWGSDEDEDAVGDARKHREDTASEDAEDEPPVYAAELHLKKNVRGCKNEPQVR